MRAVFGTTDDLVSMWRAIPFLILWQRIIFGISCLFYGPLFILWLWFDGWSSYTAMLAGTAIFLGFLFSTLSDARPANLTRIIYTLSPVYQFCGFLAFIPAAQVFHAYFLSMQLRNFNVITNRQLSFWVVTCTWGTARSNSTCLRDDSRPVLFSAIQPLQVRHVSMYVFML